MKKSSKRVIGVLIVVGLGCLVYFAFIRANGSGHSEGEEFETFTAVRSDIEAWVSAPGSIEPKFKVEVKSKASGEILQVAVEEGDYVEKGDILIKLDPSVEERNVQKAKTELSAARAKVARSKLAIDHLKEKIKRAQELNSSGNYADFDLESLKLEEAMARQDNNLARAERNSISIVLSEARERLEDTTIVSPIKGLVLARYVELGQIISSAVSNVSGGTSLLTIADMSEIRINAEVDEADVGKIKPGQKCKIRVDAYSRHEWTGVVERVSPQGYAESNVTSFKVLVIVDKSEDNNLLKPMMSAEVEILAQTRMQVVVVSTGAIRSRKGGAGVFVVEDNGQVRWQEVELGVTDGKIMEIVKGIDEGDKVITGEVPPEMMKDPRSIRVRSGNLFGKNKK